VVYVTNPTIQKAVLGGGCRGRLHAARAQLFVEAPLTEEQRQQRRALQPRVRQLAAEGVRTRWRGSELQKQVEGQWVQDLPGTPAAL
jgi:hypothetical protein